jgi:nicotinic acid mononucleotide adenylyltransferase
MSKDEADKKCNQEEYWVLLKDIALSDATATEIRRNILKEMKSKIVLNDKVENIVDDNIAKIKNYFGELN